MTLRIDPQQRHQLCELCAQAVPNEACGFLLGALTQGTTRVDRIWPAANGALADASSRYVIDPKALLEAEGFARNQGIAVVGCYHSHPSAAPIPSLADRRDAQPGWCHVIIGVPSETAHEANPSLLAANVGEIAQACDVRAWRLDAQAHFVEETIEVG